MKCDLCSVGVAEQDSLLCPACNEAIGRLATITQATRSARIDEHATAERRRLEQAKLAAQF